MHRQKGKWFRSLVTLSMGYFLMLAACAPKVVTPPMPTWPSEVVTDDGMAYAVKGLRIPGTLQELRLRQADTLMWLPLNQVESLRFTGPVRASFRPAQIFLSGGNQVRGDLMVDFLLEGTTDAGYWNMPMIRVEGLSLGTE